MSVQYIYRMVFATHYILDICSLSDVKLTKIFSQAVSCLSSLVIINVAVGKVLVFVESVEDFSF